MRFNVQTIWEPLVPRVTVNLYQKQTLADGTETLIRVDTTKTSSWDDYVNRVFGADGKQYLLGPDNKLRDPSSGGAGARRRRLSAGQAGQPPVPGADRHRSCSSSGHAGARRRPAALLRRLAQLEPGAGGALRRPLRLPERGLRGPHPLMPAQKTAGQTPGQPAAGQLRGRKVTPPGYEVVKEEDKNILIGDAFVAPVTQQFGALGSIYILPDQATLGNANPGNPNTGDPGFQSNPTTNLGVSDSTTRPTSRPASGNMHRVPDFLSLYPGAQQVAPFAGMDRPLCDRKLVALNDQMQTNATFFVFTAAPVASNNTGIILDDATAEFNAKRPTSARRPRCRSCRSRSGTWSGLEISRTLQRPVGRVQHDDASSWLVNPPTPSGYGPNMLVTCMNDPGPIRIRAGAH